MKKAWKQEMVTITISQILHTALTSKASSNLLNDSAGHVSWRSWRRGGRRRGDDWRLLLPRLFYNLAEPDPLASFTRYAEEERVWHNMNRASGSGFHRKPVEQIEPNSMNNIKIPHVQMLAKYFLCEQISIPYLCNG